MQSLFRRMRLGNCGTAAVELAILAPVLGTLMTGAWDFGNVMLQQERLTSAARAGAAYAATNTADSTNFSGMKQAARNDANDASDSLNVTAQTVCTCPTGSSVSCTGSCSGGSVWSYAQVTVTETYTTLISYPFTTNPMSLTGTVTLRVK